MEQEAPTRPRSWDQRYIDNDLPWDSGRPDPHLADVLEASALAPGRALEIGCGTGTNAIWLAQRGFDVVGIDVSATAIERAKASARSANVACEFLTTDFIADPLPGRFSLVYDRGCFHTLEQAEERARFAERVAGLLEPDGIWHSLSGSTDGPSRDSGPPRLSASEIARAVEPKLELLQLRATVFDPDDEHLRQAQAWVVVARRRPIV